MSSHSATLAPIAFVRHNRDRDFYEEAHLVAELLRGMGHRVDMLEWHDASAQWEQYGLINLQFCADYIERPAEFKAWLGRLKQMDAPLFNPADAVLWNMDKAYLKELEAKGFAGIPTVFAAPGEAVDLAAVVSAQGWREVVVKPTISAGGKTTLRFNAEDAPHYQQQLERMLTNSGVMIQAFLPEVMSAGEWSLVFIGGELSHMLHKKPATGEFLVHEHFGGTTTPAQAPAHIVEYATNLMASIPHNLMYGRVDGIDTPGGFKLMELEIIEPWLWLHLFPEKLQSYADAIAARVTVPLRQAA